MFASAASTAAARKEHGRFSIVRYPVKFPIKFGQCFLSLDGHGGRREGGATDTRNVEANIKNKFETSVLSNTASAISAEVLAKTPQGQQVVSPPVVPGLGKVMTMTHAGGVRFSVARVMGNTWSPGLSYHAHPLAPASNFTLRLPMAAQYMSSNWNSSRVDNNLLDMEGKLLTEVKTLDKASNIDYPKEKSSNPHLTSEGEYYHVVEVTPENFADHYGRVVHPVPNPSEIVDAESGRPMRFATHGPVPFKYYGLFVIAASEGGLPQECTLSYNHATLRQSVYELEGVRYPMYGDNFLQEFNVIAWENREDVETRIGVCNGFLAPDTGDIITGMQEAWKVFKHEINGPIQILRRAIYKEEITHIESAILLRSFAYIDQGILDSACNCPEDRSQECDVFNSEHESFFPPMTHDEIRTLNDEDFVFFQELYANRQTMRRIARKGIEAARHAEEAQSQAEAAAQQQTLNRSEVRQIFELALQRVGPVLQDIDTACLQTHDALNEARQLTQGLDPRIAGDPQIRKSMEQVIRSERQASNSKLVVEYEQKRLQTRLDELSHEAQPAEGAVLNMQPASNNPPTVPFTRAISAGSYFTPQRPAVQGNVAGNTAPLMSAAGSSAAGSSAAGSPLPMPLPKKSRPAGGGGSSRKLRKQTTGRRKKIMRKTKKRIYRKKSQKRNNRK